MKSIISSPRRADITIYPSGMISLTQYIVKTLGIKPGDVIDFASDEGELLLYVRHRQPAIGRYEGRCYKVGAVIRVRSQMLCKAVMQECKTQSDVVRLACGELREVKGYQCLPIIKHRL
jgi:signal peptidase I